MKRTLLLSILPFFISFSGFADESWDSHKSDVLSRQNEIHGWCSSEKASRMMDLIYNVHPDVCVEVGVFGGASIYPTASALCYLNQGVVYAIDPWENDTCLVGYTPGDANYEWWKAVDLNDIYLRFLGMLDKFNLTPYCNTMRTTGAVAVNSFDDESIDILHIDGNHSEEQAYNDIQMYYKKVKKGGYIWFDDANWVSTHKAISYLLDNCALDPSCKRTDPYLLFKKN